MATNLERTNAALNAFVASQLGFTRPTAFVDLGKSVLGIWNASPVRLLPAMVATRKLNLGTSRVKFFRRVTFHGDGEAFVAVIVDGEVVVPRAHVVMVEGPSSPATINLPRGTAGRWILLEIVGATPPESFDIEWALTT